MPKISGRGQKMPSSPIRKLVPFAEKALKEGKTIHHLNIGQPDIETPALLLEAIQHADLKILEYTHSAGTESYRKKLAGYYNAHKIPVEYTDILVTTGGSEALEIAMMSCFDPGDELIISEPFYANVNGFACAADIVIKAVTSTIESGFALPPISEFEKIITTKTKGILICNPNNPTGYLYSKEELETLKHLVVKHNLFLLSDEVYKEFCYDGKEYVSVMQLQGIDEHVVLVDSISKRYSACGARIGALVSKNKDIIATALKFGQARLSAPTLEQIGAEAAIDTPASYFEKVIKEYSARRDLVIAALNKMHGVLCPNPSGAFYCIARLPVDDADRFCQWLLESFEYNNETVMMAPASGFYATKGLGKNEVRIAYVINQKDLNSAMICLEKALKVYPGRTI